MIKYAFKSLKENKSKSFFYWFTFVLTTLLIYSIFNITSSPLSGISIGAQDTTMFTLIAILVCTVCMCVVFFANDFFVKDKSREIAVDLICGSSYLQIVEFLLIQTGIIFLSALPLGLFIGTSLIPLLNTLLHMYYQQNISITISTQSILITSALLASEIIWCTILNLGYSYRCTIRSLISGEEKHTGMNNQIFTIKIVLGKLVYIILFIIPIISIIFNKGDSSGLLIFSFIGIFGIHGIITNIIIPHIEVNGRKTYIKDTNKLIYMGLFKQDLMKVKYIILLLIMSSVMFMSILSGSHDNPLQGMVTMISYFCCTLLIMLAITFKFSNEIPKRSKIFHSLMTIGYNEKDINHSIFIEISYLYLFVGFMSLSYIIPTLINMYMNQLLTLNLMLILAGFFILCLIIGGLVNFLYYKKTKSI